MPLQFTLREVPLADICGYADQMPITFPANWHDEWLVHSIRMYGVLTPLLVSAMDDNEFCIVDGHRRFLAAKAAGMKSAPCGIGPKLSPDESEAIRRVLRSSMQSDQCHLALSFHGSTAAIDAGQTVSHNKPAISS